MKEMERKREGVPLSVQCTWLCILTQPRQRFSSCQKECMVPQILNVCPVEYCVKTLRKEVDGNFDRCFMNSCLHNFPENVS